MTAIDELKPDEIEAAVALWEACDLTRPWNDPRADIRRAFEGATTVWEAGAAAWREVIALEKRIAEQAIELVEEDLR